MTILENGILFISATKLVRLVHKFLGSFFGPILVGSLLIFEFYNYTVTNFALNDISSRLIYIGTDWILAFTVLFCGIDFIGVANLFTADDAFKATPETLILFEAWVLGITLNAGLTWWGIFVKISEGVVTDSVALNILLPTAMAFSVWAVRIVLILSLMLLGKRVFNAGFAHQ